MLTFSTWRPLAGAAITAFTVLALNAAPAAAQTVVPAQSEIGFTAKQMGVPLEGKFRQWEAQISFDPKKPEAGKVAFSIQTGSASFGSPETESEVVKAPWFNVAKFPKASFTSSAISVSSPGHYQVRGTLEVKGRKQELSIPVSLSQNGAQTVASGSFAIKRLDFQIGEGEWADTSIVANDVQVKFKLALSGVGKL